PLAGLVLVSPSFHLHLSRSERLIANFLNGIVPNLRLRHGVRAQKLSHDQVVSDAYRNDPLVNRLITPRLATFIERGGPEVIRSAGSLPVRTLLLVAGDDH